jgi:hypothetical protein
MLQQTFLPVVQPTKAVMFPMIQTMRNKNNHSTSMTPASALYGFCEMEVLGLVGLDMDSMHAQFLFSALMEMSLPSNVYHENKPLTLDNQYVTFSFHAGASEDPSQFPVTTSFLPILYQSVPPAQYETDGEYWTREWEKVSPWTLQPEEIYIFNVGKSYARGRFPLAYYKMHVQDDQLNKWNFKNNSYHAGFGSRIHDLFQDWCGKTFDEFQHMRDKNNKLANDGFVRRGLQKYADIACRLQYIIAKRFEMHEQQKSESTSGSDKSHENVLKWRMITLLKITYCIESFMFKMKKSRRPFNLDVHKIHNTLKKRVQFLQSLQPNMWPALQIETHEGISQCVAVDPTLSQKMVLADLSLMRPFDCTRGSADLAEFVTQVLANPSLNENARQTIMALMHPEQNTESFQTTLMRVQDFLFMHEMAYTKDIIDQLWSILSGMMNRKMNNFVRDFVDKELMQ